MIDYKSIPVYNFSYLFNALNPSGANAAIYTDVARNETVWTCDDWITFFEALKNHSGEAQAKAEWSYMWNLGVSKSAGGAGDLRAGSGAIYDSVPLDCRTTNSNFRDFISKYNLTDTVYKGLGVIAKPLGVGADIVNDATTAVTNLAGTITNTTTVLKYAVPVLLLTATGLLIWWGVNKAKAA